MSVEISDHIVKFGIDLSIVNEYSDPLNVVDLAVETEEAGWDGIFIWDLLNHEKKDDPVLDVTVALTAIASHTSKIKIGILVTALPRRRPWKLAKEMVTIDHLSKGRLILGVGSGFYDKDFSTFGEESNLTTRAEKLDESLNIILGLWGGTPFSYQGKHYQITDAHFLPTPYQYPRIPIWVGGSWKKKAMLRAAKYDGVYPMIESPDEFKKMVEYIKANRSTDELFEFASSGETPEDKEEAMRIIQPYIDAGATWWMVWSEESVRDTLRKIRAGPPNK
jgi:alkanesulfonate monooxygenase SsuD/methylene tetrahydromethanopterin reductase-like flavin-dependent oxidoreductase (luciferase family)